MDRENTSSKTPIPAYALGIHILLVDRDTASLKHTISILEESTYKVTSTQLPAQALTMLKEQKNGFDLVVAAADVQGMDCFAFLKSVMTLSTIPIILMSNKEDVQLAARSLQQGVSHFIEKPMKREEAQGLWQFVFRKQGNPSVRNGKPRQLTSEYKNKGTQTMMEVQNKRKNLDDAGGEKHQKLGQISNNYMKKRDVKNKKKGTSEDRIKWNAQLNEQFMKILTDGPSQETSSARQSPRIPELTMQVQPSNHLEGSRNNVDCNSIKATTHVSSKHILDGQIHSKKERDKSFVSSIPGTGDAARHGEKNTMNSKTQQCAESRNLFNGSCGVEKTHNILNQNMTTRFEDGRSSSLPISYGNGYKDSTISQVSTLYPQSNIFGIGGNSGPELVLNLKERTDLIRREYRTNKAEKEQIVLEQNCGNNGSNTTPMDFASSQQQIFQTSPALSGMQCSYVSSENSIPFFVQEADIQQNQLSNEYFDAPVTSINITHNDNYSLTNDIASGHQSYGWNFFTPQVVSNPNSENWGERQAHCSSGYNIQGFGQSHFSEKVLKNETSNNSEDIIDEDAFLDEILAEVNDDDGDLKSLGFPTLNDKYEIR